VPQGPSSGELSSPPRWDSALLFRSFGESGPSFQALAESGALLTLGDFLRCVRAVGELRELLGAPAVARGRLEQVAEPSEPVQAHLLAATERLALTVRSELGLGTAPIPSMRAVFDTLGVDLFFVTPDELDVEVDAASTVTPIPATLVNLVGGSEQWWRTRVSLAHELCHLLVDRAFFGDTSPFVMLSPASDRTARPSGVRLPAPLELLEKRARAFAIHFLVPRVELTRVLTHRDPRSEGAVTAVCQHFQVGRIAAVNQLRNVGFISEDDRKRMLGRHPASALPAQHPDADIGRTGLRGGVLRDLAMRALAKGKISPMQARSYLEVSTSDPLPRASGLAPQLRAPLLKSTDRVERVVVRRLGSEVALADCYVERIEPEGDTWRVEIAQASPRADGEPTPRGIFLVGPDLQILEERVVPRSST